MVFRKTLKNFDLENFWSKSFSIRTSCIESSRFRARVAKGRPGFQDRISRGKPRVQIRISKGSCGLRKSKKYFQLIMIRVAWNMNKSSFQKNFYFIWKNFDSENFRGTPKKYFWLKVIRVAWIVEKSFESWRKTLKNFDLENFRSESFSIRTSCIESSRFRARVAKGRPAFWDRIFRGKPRVQNRISKGSRELRKSKKYFLLIMIRGTWNMSKSKE